MKDTGSTNFAPQVGSTIQINACCCLAKHHCASTLSKPAINRCRPRSTSTWSSNLLYTTLNSFQPAMLPSRYSTRFSRAIFGPRLPMSTVDSSFGSVLEPACSLASSTEHAATPCTTCIAIWEGLVARLLVARLPGLRL